MSARAKEQRPMLLVVDAAFNVGKAFGAERTSFALLQDSIVRQENAKLRQLQGYKRDVVGLADSADQILAIDFRSMDVDDQGLCFYRSVFAKCLAVHRIVLEGLIRIIDDGHEKLFRRAKTKLEEQIAAFENLVEDIEDGIEFAADIDEVDRAAGRADA